MKLTPHIVATASMIVLLFTACHKEVATPGSNSGSSTTVGSSLQSGQWIVGSLTQKLENNTGKFSGYVFTFAAGGKLTATLSGKETVGSWSYTPAVTYYGSSSKEALIINLGTSDEFKRISKTWNVASSSSNSISFDNPEVLEDEHLRLDKK